MSEEIEIGKKIKEYFECTKHKIKYVGNFGACGMCSQEMFDDITDLKKENKRLKKTKEATDWINWAGGDCPVDSCVKVEVFFRDGDSEKKGAYNYRWDYWNTDGDIVKYKIIKDNK